MTEKQPFNKEKVLEELTAITKHLTEKLYRRRNRRNASEIASGRFGYGRYEDV